jgi:hypothetical protein
MVISANTAGNTLERVTPTRYTLRLLVLSVVPRKIPLRHPRSVAQVATLREDQAVRCRHRPAVDDEVPVLPLVHPAEVLGHVAEDAGQLNLVNLNRTCNIRFAPSSEPRCTGA